LFTLIGQCAVGLGWFFSGIHPTAPDCKWKTAAPFLLMTVAVLVSAFHLHYPKNAWRSLNNWRRSPLSQEALAAMIYSAILALEFFFILFNDFSAPPVLFTGLRFIFGFLFILSMSRLYLLRTVPIWKRASTPLSFFSSALLLGPLSATWMPVYIEQKRLWVFLSIGLILRILSSELRKQKLSCAGAIQRSRYLPPKWIITLASSWTVSLVLILTFSLNRFPIGAPINLLAFLAIAFSELLSRMLFYNSHGHDRSLYPPVTPSVSSWEKALVSENPENSGTDR